MKVLQINNVFNKGSTGKITADIHDELCKKGIESIVCYGRGKRIKQDAVYKSCTEFEAKLNNGLSRFTGLVYGGCFFSTLKLINVIKKEKPDIVHLQCINGFFVNIPKLISWLNKKHIPTVLTLHAEFMYTANCGYAYECTKWKNSCGNCPSLRYATKSLFFDRTETSWNRMEKAFCAFKNLEVVGVSNWITNRASESPILSNVVFKTIHNGIRIDNFHNDYIEDEDCSLRKKFGIPEGKRIIIHVTPGLSDPVKGGKDFIRLTKLLPDEYHAVIVGYGEFISENITSIPFTNNQKELAGLYRMADVMVITSNAENYPTVCIEANCCGTPVVGFDVGGVKETIEEGMGEVVKLFDIQALFEKTLFWSNRKKEIPVRVIQKRRSYCDKKRMAEDYIELYNDLVNRK